MEAKVYHPRAGLSQMQLQKSLEQYQKIPEALVMQQKNGVPMINIKNRTKYELQNKLKYFGKQCTELLYILIARKTATIIENIILFDVSVYV